jgi:hypothetical protein
MTAINSPTIKPKPAERPLWRDLLQAARYYLGGRRTLTVLAIAAIAGGLALNWSWLVAAGLAPLVLALLPCAAMCALHLCMKPGGGAHCKTGAARDEPRLLPPPRAETQIDGKR